MGYSVVLLSQASEAVFETAIKRAEERGVFPEKVEIAIGEVLVDIAVDEGVPLDQILRDREQQKMEALLAGMRASSDRMERIDKLLIETFDAADKMIQGKPEPHAFYVDLFQRVTRATGA